MTNPFFDSRRNAIIYVIVWILIIIIHYILISVFYEIESGLAFLDSLVYNGLFAGFALTIWYPVRYGNPKARVNLKFLLTYLFTGLIFIPVWMILGYQLLRTLVGENDEYFYFLNESYVIRIATGFLFFGLTILIYHLFIYSRELQDKKLSEARLNVLIKESELNVLRSQLNPHFLFNSLNSISSLTLSDPAMAREMIIKLSEFLRYALKHGQKETTPLAEEIRNIELYLEIERIRFGDKLIFIKDVSSECEAALIPNMILQPLFENAIKHGVYESTDTITVRLSGKKVSGDIEITILNNFDPAQVSRKGAGIGLKNVKNRMKLIYNRPNLVLINKQEGLFEVKLIIPMN